jgi:serine/threonine protein kinase
MEKLEESKSPDDYSVPKTGKDAYLYEVDRSHLIGEGGFAHVFKASRTFDQQVFAIKRS